MSGWLRKIATSCSQKNPRLFRGKCIHMVAYLPATICTLAHRRSPEGTALRTLKPVHPAMRLTYERRD